MTKKPPQNMILRNVEGHEEFNIDPNWHARRKPGISVYFRVKNEGEFIRPSILSLIRFVDEVIIALQPSEDDTLEESKKIKSDKIKIIEYPFDLLPNGPGYNKYDPKSVHCKTYYYNWALSKTTRQWALKWDGDMVALPSIKKSLNCKGDRIFIGHEIVKWSDDKMWLSKSHPSSNAAPSGFFKVRLGVRYVNAGQTHRFAKPPGSRTPGKHFLHFKWCKKHFDDIWPEGWEEIKKFQTLRERSKPGEMYSGRKPRVLIRANIK